MIFLDAAFWTATAPVEPLLLSASPHGDLCGLIHLTDDVSEAAALLAGG